MKRLLYTTLLATIALGLFTGEAKASSNTGYTCTNPGQLVHVAPGNGPGSWWICSGSTWTWWSLS